MAIAIVVSTRLRRQWGIGQGATPLVGLLVLLGGGSSKTESGSNGGVPFSWFPKSG